MMGGERGIMPPVALERLAQKACLRLPAGTGLLTDPSPCCAFQRAYATGRQTAQDGTRRPARALR